MEGDTGQARTQQGSGSFKLRIPAQHLQDALGAMSGLAHVSSRTEGTVDITKRFDAAKARVDDLEAERAHLLRQLADAFTVTERQSIKQRLAIVESQLADARDHYGHVQQRIHLVPVSVEVLGQRGVGGGGGGSWNLGRHELASELAYRTKHASTFFLPAFFVDTRVKQWALTPRARLRFDALALAGEPDGRAHLAAVPAEGRQAHVRLALVVERELHARPGAAARGRRGRPRPC
jgi:hypothetical protein